MSAAAHLLVVDGGRSAADWGTIFSGRDAPVPPAVSASATPRCGIVVHQGGWHEISLTCDSRGALVDIRGGPSFRPDFLLVRNEVRGAAGQDWRNILYGLAFAGVPSVNSVDSILMFCERPVAHGQLVQIQRRVGKERFPLVEAHYFPTHRQMLFGPPFPAVVKVAHGEAGLGKMIVRSPKDFTDFASVMALTTHYLTAEPFVEHAEYDIRLPYGTAVLHGTYLPGTHYTVEEKKKNFLLLELKTKKK